MFGEEFSTIEGGDKQTLNLAPGSSKFYVAPKKFSHPPVSIAPPQ
jgi:hypothetical protein